MPHAHPSPLFFLKKEMLQMVKLEIAKLKKFVDDDRVAADLQLKQFAF